MCRKTARGPTQTVEVVPVHHPRSTAGGPTCGQFPFLESTCLLRTIMPAFVLGRATIGITITTDPVNDTDDVMGDHSPADGPDQNGSASCRERVCQYGYNSVVAVELKKK